MEECGKVGFGNLLVVHESVAWRELSSTVPRYRRGRAYWINRPARSWRDCGIVSLRLFAVLRLIPARTSSAAPPAGPWAWGLLGSCPPRTLPVEKASFDSLLPESPGDGA